MSSETIEPLALLRDYLINERKVSLVENKMLQFDNFENKSIRLSVTTPTAWKIKNKTGEFYTLGSIWVIMTNQNKGKKISEIMKQATDLGVAQIGYIE
tara:strand:+ start:79 stop:372 length:294 start_codon:yes stop_codon:yes gene_type:complete